ncbi:substrate-binding protein [Pollutimonas thiosulfatoxidans]|uniref:Branched-chain amino acid ABC transporter substrate-binding protein n=1 Tax=Pollutimonas thiosulfatoxidans TaxID=2028345 RepID=A0A410GBJ4_9BURK|nr:substrate-binding protein [Pollutimonas thiosulfatoxidans]MBF6617828.1 substrate-binding protein [Candidimonas sp.]QAA93676.1 branched-chain amino acid ABC transporter substrate-binding protein [Pollutimonas thiosulfatoxidans]
MEDKKSIKQGVDRRSMLKLGAAGAAGSMLLPGMSGVAVAAEEKKPVGNYPAGVEGDTVFIGLTLDITGPYSAQGADQQKGYELAVEQLNAGAEEVKKISPLTKKGVLGKKVEFGVADAETKPNTAVQAATRFIHNNKAMMISGSTSSAVAIALQKVCDRERTIYLPAISGSNETTGVDCQRYGFRLCYFAYTACQAIAPVLAKNLGKDRKAIYLVPDYTYGHTTYDSMVEFTEKQGWKTVGSQVHPLGAKDYSSFLINIANSDADTLVVIAYGADAANSIKQAKQFGLLERMNIVVPYMSAFLEKEIGEEIMQGVYGATGFWWTLQDQYPVAKDFVTAFEKKFNAKPRDSAYIAYLTTVLWADACERAGSFYPPDVIKAYEAGEVRQGPVGDVTFRAEDHQGVINFPIVRGKKPADMKNPDDYFEVVEVVDGRANLPELGVLGCKLGEYV